MKVYIAFSIEGTCAFITAVNEVKSIQSLGHGFTEVKRRRLNYKPEDGIKLHWEQLLNKKGEPLKGPATVLQRFKELSKYGWTVDKEAFVKRHYPSKKKQ